VVARDRSRLRPDFCPATTSPERLVDASGLVLDPQTRRVVLGGDDVALTRRQFALLHVLVAHPSRLLTARELSTHAWNEPWGSQESVRQTVKSIRSRLREAGVSPQHLATVRGLGYRWDPPVPTVAVSGLAS
jgi:DNA-binding response OmpR family regulator